MNEIVLDASALLALINREKGYEDVQASLSQAVMSTVNVSEVAAVLCNIGMPLDEIKPLIQDLLKKTIPFDEEQAFIAAGLRKETKAKGLSLGDRACLALAIDYQLPILTADKAWTEFESDLQITLIR